MAMVNIYQKLAASRQKMMITTKKSQNVSLPFQSKEAREDPQAMALHQTLPLVIPSDIQVQIDPGSEFPD